MKKIAGKKEKIKHLLPIESVFNALLRKLELKFEAPKSAKWSAQKGVKAVGEGECGELPIQWNRRDWNAIIFWGCFVHIKLSPTKEILKSPPVGM